MSAAFIAITFQRLSWTIILVGSVSSIGCKADRARPATYEVFETTRPLIMDSIKSIRLGDRPSNTAVEIEDAVVTSDRVYVIDGATHHVLGYSRSGSPILSIPYGSGAAIKSPIDIDASPEMIGLLELSRTDGIIGLTSNGAVPHRIPLNLESSAIDMVSIGNQFAVATIQRERDLAAGTGSIVSIVNSEGKVVARGCTPNPLYASSVKQHGMLQFFRQMGVTTGQKVIYCRQPVSPVVQMISSTGTSLGVVTRAPPFYRAPVDVPQSTNQRQVERFRATWTEHVQFYPTVAGFVSIYLTYDTTAGRNEYDVFVCDSASGPIQCRAGRAPGKPIDLLGSDTLVIWPVGASQGMASLVLYQLRQ